MSRGEDASPTLCADPLCRQFCVGRSEPSRTDRPGLSAPPPARRWGVTSQRGPAGTGDQRRVHREHGRQGYGLRHAAQRPGARLEVRSASNVGSAFDCPDPFVLRARSIYLGFAREEPPSGGSSSRPVFATNSALGTIQVIHSPDAHTWLPLGDALPSLPAWATPPVPRPVGPCTEAAAPAPQEPRRPGRPSGQELFTDASGAEDDGDPRLSAARWAHPTAGCHVAHVALSGLGPVLRP